MEKFIVDLSKVQIRAEEDCIICDNYMMHVDVDYEFTYKLMKTKIKAIGGASRLAKQLEEWISQGEQEVIRIGKFALCSYEVQWASKVISHVKTFGTYQIF